LGKSAMVTIAIPCVSSLCAVVPLCLCASFSPPLWLCVLLWLFVVGGAMGSFLNVVVYRLPRGMSLVWPGSHCPICSHAIRWHDNVPVLGWLILRGRCRDCRAPIAMRYPLVEALTALLFLLLAAAEAFSGGANLPGKPQSVLPELGAAGYQAGGIYAFHLVLLCTLLPAALIEYDGQRIPWALGVPAMFVGLTAPAVWPFLHPVASGLGLSGAVGGLADGLAGLAAGTAVGCASMLAVRQQVKRGAMMAPQWIGLFLGWQAVVGLAAVVMVVAVGWTLLRRLGAAVPQIYLTGWWAIGTVGWILFWRPLVEAVVW
jgi:prepilin signal peptidase PulO-like enzyme (type II secretory pathway)